MSKRPVYAPLDYHWPLFLRIALIGCASVAGWLAAFMVYPG